MVRAQRWSTGHGVRLGARKGSIRGSTAGFAPDYVQANLLILPEEVSEDFRRYCLKNPRPCPLLEVLEPGAHEPRKTAPGADLRTDLPRYRVYRDGELAEERDHLRGIWSPRRTAFLLGCSFTFESALRQSGISFPHSSTGRPVAMYRTSLSTRSAGPFGGPLVVSMRWIPEDQVERAAAVTGRYPLAHGPPIHVGTPERLGIQDLDSPEWGEAWPRPEGGVAVFWACGVTSQVAAAQGELPLFLSHAPGAMFVTDLLLEEIEDRPPPAESPARDADSDAAET